MIAIAYYLLKVTILSGLLFGYYHLALKDKVFHQWNRFYLLVTVVVSLMVPLISFPVQTTEQHNSSIVSALQVVSGADEYVSDHQSAPVATITVETIVSGLFLLVSMALFAILILAILRIVRISGKYDALQLDDIVFINTREEGTPFSFFRRIFWNEEIDLHSPQGKTIFEHEMVHVRENHTLDKIFIQLVLIPCWINPVFWLIRKELKMIHEFIADNKAIENKDRTVLAELIFQTAYPQYSHLISNPFFQSSIKRRLSMLSKTNNPSMHYMSRIAALILVSCLVLAFTIKPQINKGYITANVAEKVRVVIDAGHGGVDPGVVSGELMEKNISLAISQWIKTLNKNENLDIILTRSDDEYMDVKEKLAFSTSKKADMLISIHVNDAPSSTKNSKSGFEANITSLNNSYKNQNLRIASFLLQDLSSVYTVIPNVQTIDKSYILNHSTSPSVLLECGYISNDKDREFLSNPQNQQKIAENILRAVEKYFSKEIVLSEPTPTSSLDTVPSKKKPAAKTPTRSVKPKVTVSATTAVDPVVETSVNTNISTNVQTSVNTENVKSVTANVNNAANVVNSKVSTTSKTVNVSKVEAKSITVQPVKPATSSVSVQGSTDKTPYSVSGTVTSNKTSATSISMSTSQSEINGDKDSSGSFKINYKGNQPLYILDGKVVKEAVINELNPNRIASIEVLKDETATKLYGEAAKNGVIKITTK